MPRPVTCFATGLVVGGLLATLFADTSRVALLAGPSAPQSPSARGARPAVAPAADCAAARQERQRTATRRRGSARRRYRHPRRRYRRRRRPWRRRRREPLRPPAPGPPAHAAAATARREAATARRGVRERGPRAPAADGCGPRRAGRIPRRPTAELEARDHPLHRRREHGGLGVSLGGAAAEDGVRALGDARRRRADVHVDQRAMGADGARVRRGTPLVRVELGAEGAPWLGAVARVAQGRRHGHVRQDLPVLVHAVVGCAEPATGGQQRALARYRRRPAPRRVPVATRPAARTSGRDHHDQRRQLAVAELRLRLLQPRRRGGARRRVPFGGGRLAAFALRREWRRRRRRRAALSRRPRRRSGGGVGCAPHGSGSFSSWM